MPLVVPEWLDTDCKVWLVFSEANYLKFKSLSGKFTNVVFGILWTTSDGGRRSLRISLYTLFWCGSNSMFAFYGHQAHPLQQRTSSSPLKSTSEVCRVVEWSLKVQGMINTQGKGCLLPPLSLLGAVDWRQHCGHNMDVQDSVPTQCSNPRMLLNYR